MTENHSAAQFVLDRADTLDEVVTARFSGDGLAPALRTVATIMRREAHLCTFAYREMVNNGMPDGTAFTLAQDDMGFQLVHALAKEIQG